MKYSLIFINQYITKIEFCLADSNKIKFHKLPRDNPPNNVFIDKLYIIEHFVCLFEPVNMLTFLHFNKV